MARRNASTNGKRDETEAVPKTPETNAQEGHEMLEIRHQGDDRYWIRFRTPDGREIAHNVSQARLKDRAEACRVANQTQHSERIQAQLDLTEWILEQLP